MDDFEMQSVRTHSCINTSNQIESVNLFLDFS